ncbi:MAG: hypothetical protein AB1458_14265 [Bacteroidota bacterium]
MKKAIMILALAFGTTAAFAQDLTSKKGEPYLPEEGDWAICFDARPFLTYAGNLFSGNTGSNSSPAVMYPGNMPWGIHAKMFKDATTAYRAMIRLGFGSVTMNNYVTQDGQTDPNVKVTDEWKSSARNILLGGGLEMRRGKTRLQGYYGGMVWIMLGGGSDTYTYGNAFSTTNTSATFTNWPSTTPTTGSSRTTEVVAGSTFGFGIRGFIGAEYFILPKISIGAEYGWGIGMSNMGDGEMTTESWDFANNTIKTTTSKTGGVKSFGLDVDISNNMLNAGALNICFHF